MGEDGVDERIWSLQSGRFGQFYCHLKGSGGVDVCLSHHASYALCCTLRAAIINGEEVWGRQKVCHVLCNLLAKGASSKEEAASAVNSACVTLQLCQDVEDGCVYHIRRKLRRVDKKSSLPLRSFVDLWNEKMPLTHAQKLILYMNAHPSENVLEVMRKHGFRFIPTEIRIRFHIPRTVKLYETEKN